MGRAGSILYRMGVLLPGVLALKQGPIGSDPLSSVAMEKGIYSWQRELYEKEGKTRRPGPACHCYRTSVRPSMVTVQGSEGKGARR